jgi:hypothetical protein
MFTSAIKSSTIKNKELVKQTEQMKLQLDNYRNLEIELRDCKADNNFLLTKLKFSDKNFEMNAFAGVETQETDERVEETFDNAYLNDLKLGTPFEEIVKSVFIESQNVMVKNQLEIMGNKSQIISTPPRRRTRLSMTKNSFVLGKSHNRRKKFEIAIDRRRKRDLTRDHNRQNLNDDFDESVIETAPNTAPNTDVEDDETDWEKHWQVGFNDLVGSTPKCDKSLRNFKNINGHCSLIQKTQSTSSDTLERYQSCRSLGGEISSVPTITKSCTRNFVNMHIAVVNRMSDYTAPPRMRELKNSHYEGSDGSEWKFKDVGKSLSLLVISSLTVISSMYRRYFNRNE